MLASLLTSGAYGYLSDYLLWLLLYMSLLVNTWCFFRLFPRKKYRKLGLVLGNGLVFLCMLGLMMFAAESYLRFLAVETDAFGVSLPARRWFALHTELNSLGCRDEEWTVDKPPGVWRIAFVGDSVAYGWGIERVEDRFSDRIGAMFDRGSDGRFETMNVAKPGWDTSKQLQPIKDMIEHYSVDEIVLCYMANDIEGLLPTTDDFNPKRPPDWNVVNLDSSPLLDYLYRRLYLPHVPTVSGYHDWLAAGIADQRIWQRHLEQFGELVSHCRDRGVTFRVVLIPFLRTTGKGFQQEDLHAGLRDFFEANDIPVVDLLPVVKGLDASELVVNSADPHPNERTHRMFADAIWQGFYAASKE